MTWTLKVLQGAQLAEGLVPEVVLPQPLQRLSIGRDPQSHWLFADRTKAISGRHCEIVDSPAGPVLRDLSTNGTFVNGATTRMASEHVLRDGDRIEMGPYVVIVSGPPMPPRPHEVPPTVAPPPARQPGVMDTAPIRGGDPAAMLAAGGGHEAVRLTEILRVARPREDSGVELTKIRLATPAAPKTAPPPVRPPPPPPPEPGHRPAWRRPCRVASACPSRPCTGRSFSCWPSSWRPQRLPHRWPCAARRRRRCCRWRCARVRRRARWRRRPTR
jgi:pSer/pThr/pTyr-binding forkhead associated (FHA) protein